LDHASKLGLLRKGASVAIPVVMGDSTDDGVSGPERDDGGITARKG